MFSGDIMEFNRPIAVISIDDGNFEDFRVYEEVLKEYNVPATFNIVSGRLDNEGSLTTENLKTMFKDPLIEIAAHGYSHKNDDNDITKDIDTLSEILEADLRPIGFASPGSGMKKDFISENVSHLKSLGLCYVRTDVNLSPSPKHLEIVERLRKEGASEFVINHVPQLTFSPDFCVNSVVVLHDTDAGDLKALVDLAIREKACIVFMFHHTKKSDEKDYDSLWNYDYYKFKEFAEYLSKSEIKVLTTKEAFKNCP